MRAGAGEGPPRRARPARSAQWARRGRGHSGAREVSARPGRILDQTPGPAGGPAGLGPGRGRAPAARPGCAASGHKRTPPFCLPLLFPDKQMIPKDRHLSVLRGAGMPPRGPRTCGSGRATAPEGLAPASGVAPGAGAEARPERTASRSPSRGSEIIKR